MCFFPSLMLVRNFHREREKNKKKNLFFSPKIHRTTDDWILQRIWELTFCFFITFLYWPDTQVLLCSKIDLKFFTIFSTEQTQSIRFFVMLRQVQNICSKIVLLDPPPSEIIEAWSKNVRIIKTKTIYNCWSCFKHSKRKTSM